MTIDTPAMIDGFRLLALRQMLKLEMLGMRHSSGTSALKTLRSLGVVSAKTRQGAMDELNALLADFDATR